jgi:hypothetical protein
MVKFFAMAAAIVGTLMVADWAQARGRHGCSSCGGCPGGVCAVPVAPGKSASLDNAPPGLVGSPAPAAPVATATQPAPTYYASTTARRGLFGWRR